MIMLVGIGLVLAAILTISIVALVKAVNVDAAIQGDAKAIAEYVKPLLLTGQDVKVKSLTVTDKVTAGQVEVGGSSDPSQQQNLVVNGGLTVLEGDIVGHGGVDFKKANAQFYGVSTNTLSTMDASEVTVESDLLIQNGSASLKYGSAKK